ncbi:MAG TPA: hypothetical protein ENJ09_03075 [Planctomycetes bacterium]|nr:hypothetical protein [Planctomycetota bacterium]
MHTPHALVLTLLLLVAGCRTASPSSTSPQSAHPTCALCDKPIPDGKAVTLVLGDTTSFYRCPHCALTAQAGLRERSVLHARSGVDGREIEVTHDGAAWEVEPRTAVFLSLPETAGECLQRHKAFTDEDEYERYLSDHPEFGALGPKPYTIDEIARVLAAGLPEDGSTRVAAAPDAPHVLVVGMVTHLPFKTDVLPAIEEATAPLAGRIHLQFVDATGAPGKAILGAHGIHEHLPVVIFVDDRSQFEVAGHSVDFRGFPGEESWTAADLSAVLHAELERGGTGSQR